MNSLNQSTIEVYLNGGSTEVDVTQIDGVCCAFTGNVIGKIKTDTDGSSYVTVSDMEGNAYDVGLSYIDLP